MTKNNTGNLKEILFETLSGLIDKSIDIQTAKAISDTAQTILNAAKVEMEFAKLCKQKPEYWLANSASGFVVDGLNVFPGEARLPADSLDAKPEGLPQGDDTNDDIKPVIKESPRMGPFSQNAGIRRPSVMADVAFTIPEPSRKGISSTKPGVTSHRMK